MGPVAVSVTGESFNLTSEEIATQLAIKLKAEKMIGFCSSQGVYNQAGEIVSELFLMRRKPASKSWKQTKTITPAPCASCAGR